MKLTLDIKFLKNNMIIFALFTCSLLTGIIPQTLLSFIVVVLCCILMLRDELFMAYPFIIFYNQWYGRVFGLSVQRIFTLLVLVLLIFKLLQNKSVRLKRNLVLPVVVYILYALLVVSQYSLLNAFYSMVDVISCVLLIVFYFEDNKENLKRFFVIYVYVALVAILTGLLMENVMSYGILERFMATFEDPNYMGFFYTVAVFAVLCLELFRPWIRIIVIGILYVVIMMSLSMTAVMANLLLWLVYFAVTKKITIKTVVGGIVLLFLGLQVYAYGLANPEYPFLGDLCGRIEETITEFILGDMSGVTTGRTPLIQEHFEYYTELPILNILFGGIPVNSSYIYREFEMAAHNEFVDLLLNIGLVGTVIFIGFLLSNMITYMKKYMETKDKHYLCMFMFKCAWTIYAMTLTVLLDDRFMLPFFI